MADRRLQVFNAVAKYGSFTRAAEHLYMTQPAVTFQIKQLEEQYSVRLLDRGHGRITLTEAGRLVQDYAERILDLSDELDTRVNELTSELSGMLRIGSSTNIAEYWLPYLVEDFARNFPRVVPRVVVGNSQTIENGVLARTLDIGLIEIISEDPLIERQGATCDEVSVVCAPQHPLARERSLSASQLFAYPIIQRDPGNALQVLAERFFRAAGVNPDQLKVCAELGSLTAVKHLAAQGVGYAMSSRAAIHDEVGRGELVAVPLDPPMFTPIEIIVLKDKFRSRLSTTFAERAIEAFRHQSASAGEQVDGA